MARVSVQIEWPPGLTSLPPDARAHVTVEDATRADASSVVIAETVLADLDVSHAGGRLARRRRRWTRCQPAGAGAGQPRRVVARSASRSGT